MLEQYRGLGREAALRPWVFLIKALPTDSASKGPQGSSPLMT